jgi:hypothetical protein
MSFMSKGAAAWWAECCSSAVPFPFPTWARFEAELCLQFIEENEQDQALTKLESHSYFQSSHDIYRYTDNFEELAITAHYTNTLVQVTKYRSGLDPQINVTITTSGTARDLTDYNGWRAYAPSGSTKCSATPHVTGRSISGWPKQIQLTNGHLEWSLCIESGPLGFIQAGSINWT